MNSGFLKTILSTVCTAFLSFPVFAAPSVKFVEGQLIAPTATPLGAGATRTTSVPGYAMPDEISALSKGLGAGDLTTTEYAQRVYEYVRRNIDVEFRYGLGKGAVGALIDQSGTPFDQAELMVKLLRAGGITASYKVGTATLSADQVGKWTGLVNGLNESTQTFTVDKKAICKLFADGGIPASFSGSSSATCAYSGNLTGASAVVISHVWVTAGGVLFDPSFKEHKLFNGMNLGAAMGCATTCASELATIFGTIGTTSGVPSKSAINEEGTGGIHAKLASNAEALIASINAMATAPELEQVVGGKVILDADPLPNIAGGLPYATGTPVTWTGEIPDAYRTSVRIEFAGAIDQTYFVDELAGERLRLLPAKNKSGAPTPAGIPALFYGSRQIAGQNITTAVTYTAANRFIRFTVNYPYAAQSGAYLDETFSFTPQLWVDKAPVESIFAPMSLIVGVGRQDEGYEKRVADKVNAESLVLTNDGNNGCSFTYDPTDCPKDGLFHLSKDLPIITAKWLSASGRSMKLVSGISKAAITHHATVGFIESVDTTKTINTPINAHSRYSISQPTVNATQRSATAITVAAALNALEGGIVRGQHDSPFSTSAIGAIHMANLQNPTGGTTPPNSNYRTGSLTFLHLTSPGQESLLDAAALDTNGGIYKGYETQRRAYVGSLLTAGFDVIVPKQGAVGLLWSPWNVEWKIIPVIAIAPNATEVSYMIMNSDGPFLVYKGGGSNLPEAMDPLKTALDAHGALKSPASRFPETSVDTSSGVLKFTPPADITTGSGDFPYSLSFQRTYASTASADGFGETKAVVDTSTEFRIMVDYYNERALGWSHNFQITAASGSDAHQGLGSDSATDAAASIAALYAAYQLNNTGVTGQDIKYWLTTALTMNWFEESLYDNVVTVGGGPAPGAYVRSPDRTRFLPPNGSIADLTQSGVKTQLPFVQTLGDFRWDYRPVTYSLNLRDGQTLAFNQRLHGNISNTVDSWERGLGATTWSNSIAGVTVTLTWAAGTDRVTEIANSLGRKITINYGASTDLAAPLIRGVTDENGRSASFDYVLVSSALISNDSGGNETSQWSFRYHNRIYALSSVTDAEGHVANYGYSNLASTAHDDVDVQLAAYYRPSNLTTPFFTFTYDEQQRPVAFFNTLGHSTKYFTGSIATERRRRGYVVDATNFRTVAYYNDAGQPVEEINPAGERTFKTYDGIGRLTQATAPEGNAVKYLYDSRHNIVEERKVAKAGSGLADIVIDFGWAIPSGVNRMAWSEDALSRRTDYVYDAQNRLTQIQQPTVNSVRPTKIITYQTYAGVGSFVKDITEPDGIKTCFTYDAANKYALKTATASCQTAGLNLATTLTTNVRGDVTAVNGPRTDVTDVTTFEFDNLRRPTAKIDALANRTEVSIDEDGLLSYVREQTGATTWATTNFGYDGAGRLYSTTDPDGFISYQWYDAASRPLVAQDAEGRRTLTVYGVTGQHVSRVIKAWAGSNSGTGATTNCATMRADTAADPTKLQQCYENYSYTLNRLVADVYDANGNRTHYEYDGYDRLYRTYFPSKTTAGSYSTTDYEEYSYDANGNMTSKRARDGRTITFTYDTLDRLTQRVVPGSGDASGNYETFDFTYDFAGRQLTNDHWGTTISNVYDAAGRLASKRHNNAKSVSYDYDPAGNVTHLTYPDGFVVRYTYDALNRVERAQQVNAPTDTGYIRQFAHVGYDALSRRSFLRYLPNAFSTAATYGYSMRGDLLCQEWNFAGTRPPQCGAAPNANAPEIAYDFSYNGVGQLTSETASDPLVALAAPGLGTDVYASNGLNQYSSVKGAAIAYDGNGNVTTDHRGRAYVYSAENQLYTVREAGTNALLAQNVYYGDGTRRYLNSAASGVRRFYYDGDQEIAEYDSAGTALVRRYIRLPGSVDEPLLMIDYSLNAGCTLTSDAACQRWAHQNRQGSVVAVTDSAGAVAERHRYGAYGEIAGSTSGFPFRFTGQKLDPETGLYHYKARFYDPETGRFLQTDPIGYRDQMNLYAYVGNDPVNKTDPTGEYIESLIDVGLIAADIASIASSGFTAENTASLAGNLVGLALPGATGVGVAARGAVTAVKAADKAKDTAKAGAAAERAKNIEKGIPESKLGPSGKPRVHSVQHSTRKEAQQAAKREADKAGGQVRNDAHPQDGQKPHFQAEDAKGENVKPVVHHCKPDKAC